MDWFERITGFKEGSYEKTRARLLVEGDVLVSRTDGARHRIGLFDTPTLDALRRRSQSAVDAGRRTRVVGIVGDVRALHAERRFAGATFQVASQFNALEMVSPDVTPEHGVTRYVHDRTQGPACAMAAGAATIWRNYLAPVASQQGQTADRQIDTLAPLGHALSTMLGLPVDALWSMRNGYALGKPDGLRAIGELLARADEGMRDGLRGCLALAWQLDADVTDMPPGARSTVSHILCSALPVAYTRVAPRVWEPLARLILEAAYEGTLRAAALQHASGGSNVVLLTRLGGGVFGNDDEWIDDAIERALGLHENAALEVYLVSYGSLHPSFRRIADSWRARPGPSSR